ncbi:MAG TPA: hexitol phosphatase HxpB [Polyangiaceae bacterium]|nr:hexitol phosphatase HxpB [Polyangiaceae bacterium]
MFSAVIFDMDGLLVDSEPHWRAAEIQVFEEHLGVRVTEAQCAETMGIRIDHVVRLWLDRHPKPGVHADDLVRIIVDAMCQRMRDQGVALPGVHELVTLLKRRALPLAVASSSPRRLIDAVLERLQLSPAFTVVHSAEEEARGKPDPAVFLTTARLLQVAPSACLVFEDSVAGVQAARSAGMHVVAVPAADQRHRPEFADADLILDSLECFTNETFTALQH